LPIKGGLLGRPVEFVRYDDHADVLRVSGIYKKLMDEDKVDLVIGGYGANAVLPAMPLIMERQRFFVGLMGLGVNNALASPNYFAMIPTGPDPNAALTEGFFALAAQQKPRPACNGGTRVRRRRVFAQSDSRRESQCQEIRF
jgi:branched-chain amino acid transport system substrate-binding protein